MLKLGFKPTRTYLHKKMYASSSQTLKTKIDAANKEVLSRLQKGTLILEDIVPAAEVIPFLGKNKKSFLHAGPPVTFDRMCNAMKGSAVGMILMEGWATTPEAALAMMKSGEIVWAANNDNNSTGPMSGIITPSYYVYVVHNTAFGNKSYSRPADLHQQFGNYHKIDAVKAWRNQVGPALRKGLKAVGPIDLYPMLQQSLEYGDELHNRVNAFTMLLAAQLAIGMVKADLPKKEQLETLNFLYNDPNGCRLTLGLAMACGQAILNPGCGVEYSTILSCMARNGTDWGIRTMASHPEWYYAPAPTCHKYFIFPPFKREDFGNDMGDSVITESAGWGAFLSGNSLALAYNVGITVDEAFEGQKFNREYCLGSNDKLKVPSFGFQSAPLGLDLRQVIKRDKPFLINTGIAHKEMGFSVVARGLLWPPMDAFKSAATAWCKKYNVTMDEFVKSLE